MSEDRNLAVINEANAEQAGRIVGLSEIESPAVIGAHQVWCTLRGMRPFPSRAEITPRRFAKFLPFITLLKVHDGGADFELRLMGCATANAIGDTCRGMRKEGLNRLQPGFGNVIAHVCGYVVRSRAILPLKGRFEQSKGDAFRQETIFFPLGEHERTVDHILSIGDYTPVPLEPVAD